MFFNQQGLAREIRDIIAKHTNDSMFNQDAFVTEMNNLPFKKLEEQQTNINPALYHNMHADNDFQSIVEGRCPYFCKDLPKKNKGLALKIAKIYEGPYCQDKEFIFGSAERSSRKNLLCTRVYNLMVSDINIDRDQPALLIPCLLLAIILDVCIALKNSALDVTDYINPPQVLKEIATVTADAIKTLNQEYDIASSHVARLVENNNQGRSR